MPSEDERYTGCIIGKALGDALGFVVEGQPPKYCKDYVETILEGAPDIQLGRPPFPFGQYTDDTQLARELMQSFVEQRGFDQQDYANRVAAIFTEGRIVGRGQATESAAMRIALGVPPDQAGAPAPSAGNGSAMRAAPVGLFYDDEERVIEVACLQGQVTHQDPRCSAGAVTMALTTRTLRMRGMRGMKGMGGALDTRALLGQLVHHTRPISADFADALEALPSWLQLSPEDAVLPISQIGKPEGFDDGWRGISPFVTGSVIWSLYAFLRSPDDYWETVKTAIKVGGDVDTTAAMAGALSGIHLGLSAIPASRREKLNDQGSWDHDALCGLALQVAQLQTD